jgi:hypothetical protein
MLEYVSFTEEKEEKPLSAGVLANRPLPALSLSEMKAPKDCPKCGGTSVQPAKESDTNVFKEQHVAAEINEKPISVIFTKVDNTGTLNAVALDSAVDSDYFLLDHEETNGSILNPLPTTTTSPKKMDVTTQFYIGGITVLGLYLLYKMIQKSI